MKNTACILLCLLLAIVAVKANAAVSGTGTLPASIRNAVFEEIKDAQQEGDNVVNLSAIHPPSDPIMRDSVVDAASEISKRSFLSIKATETDLPVDLVAEAEKREEKYVPLSHDMMAAQLVEKKQEENVLNFIQVSDFIGAESNEPVTIVTVKSNTTVPTSTLPVKATIVGTPVDQSTTAEGVHHQVLKGYKHATVLDKAGNRVARRQRHRVKTVPAGSLKNLTAVDSNSTVKPATIIGAPAAQPTPAPASVKPAEVKVAPGEAYLNPTYYQPGQPRQQVQTQAVRYYPLNFLPPRSQRNPLWYPLPIYSPRYAPVFARPSSLEPLAYPSAAPTYTVRDTGLGGHLLVTENARSSVPLRGVDGAEVRIVGRQFVTPFVGRTVVSPAPMLRPLPKLTKEQQEKLREQLEEAREQYADLLEKAKKAARAANKAMKKAAELKKEAKDGDKEDKAAAKKAILKAKNLRKKARCANRKAKRAHLRVNQLINANGYTYAHIRGQPQRVSRRMVRPVLHRPTVYSVVLMPQRRVLPGHIRRMIRRVPRIPPPPASTLLRHAAEDLRQKTYKRNTHNHPAVKAALNAADLALDTERLAKHLARVATKSNGINAANYQLPGSFTPRPRFQRLRSEIQSKSQAEVEAEAAGEAAAKQYLAAQAKARADAEAEAEIQGELENTIGATAEQRLSSQLQDKSEMKNEQELDMEAKATLAEQQLGEQQVDLEAEEEALAEGAEDESTVKALKSVLQKA